MKTQTIKTGIKGALVLAGLCVLVPSVYGQGIGLKEFNNMLIKTDTKLKRGQVIWQRQCASCHGDTGANDTEIAKQNPLLEAGGFANGQYKYGGSLVQIYNVISGPVEGVKHPVFDGYLRYQDRWAVSHYTQSLSGKQPVATPIEVLEQAKFDAINGVCKEELRESIAKSAQPKGKEQLEMAAKLYTANCSSCHGEKGNGQGAGGVGLNPAPRNFVGAKKEAWKNGTSPFGIFKTLANGIAGGSMAAYTQLSEDERWALSHYVRQWVPASEKSEVSEEDILAVCRTLSSPPDPDPIPLEQAMKFLIQDAPQKKSLARQYGPIYQYSDSNITYGKDLYDYNCASCHGANGSGSVSKPYGSYPPYLYLDVDRLEPSLAGGTYEAFAKRSVGGVHATLPNMTGAALFSEQDWKNLQAYVSKFEGEKQFVSVSAKKAPKVMVVGTKLTISDRVYFELGTAKLDPRSNALLDEVARVLNQAPQIQLVQIEGHTDKSGSAATNIPLSANRAKAVRSYLISKGIDASRLRAKGYGSSRPLVTNTKDDTTEANRRVEFTILKQATTPVVVPVPNAP